MNVSKNKAKCFIQRFPFPSFFMIVNVFLGRFLARKSVFFYFYFVFFYKFSPQGRYLRKNLRYISLQRGREREREREGERDRKGKEREKRENT